MFIMLVISTMCIGFVSCGGDDDDNGGGGTLPNPDTTERLAGSRLYSINGMPITYDDINEEVSIYTSRWGNVNISLSVTLNGNYLSQYSDGERTSVTWSGGNPVKSSGKGFVSQATYGEQCNDKAFCMAFNLYAMLYGDVYKPHILGVLYGHSYYNKFGVNANQLVKHVEYHETDDSEYDDMSVDFDYQKDAQGYVTLVTYHIKKTSYKNGEVLSSGEKTETISFIWNEFKLADYYDGTLYYKVISNTEAQVVKARKDCSDVIIPSEIQIEGKTYSVTSIGKSTFKSNEKLSSVEIKEGVTVIGEGSFRLCTNLRRVKLPNSLISIEQEAFRVCSNLTSIDLPSGLKEIGTQCFSYSSINSVSIPRGVAIIDGFSNCESLQSVILQEGASSIAVCAFSGCTNLTTINIPKSVTRIDAGAFSDCSSLTAIDIPVQVVEIGGGGNFGTFDGCKSLIEIKIPENITILPSSTFQNCTSLSTVYLPSTLTNIGDHAFYNCTGLKDFYCLADAVPKCYTYKNKHPFENSNWQKAVLHVPSTSINQYSNVHPWSAFSSIVRTE